MAIIPVFQTGDRSSIPRSRTKYINKRIMPYKNKEDNYRNQQKYRETKYDLMIAYLSDNPCVDCGESDIIVLEFDHLPQFEKKFDIARAVSSSTRSWKSILLEITKCEVVCANDHRRRTSDRLTKHYKRL